MSAKTTPATSPTSMSLEQAWRAFFRHPTPWLLGALVAASWISRLALGSFSWWDVMAIATVLVAEAFVEWTTHVLVLHFKPRKIAGRNVDPYIARKHRAHHLDPRDEGLVFVPMPVLIELLVLAPVILIFAIPRHGVAVTAIASAYTMLGAYEWTHFLIHSSYRPKSRYYSYIRRAHWNHHYRNEHYWFGITMHVADHLFRTFPDKAAVEVSPTARTLGAGP